MNNQPRLDIELMDAQTEAKARSKEKYPDRIMLDDLPKDLQPGKLSELICLVYENAFIDGFNFNRNKEKK